MRLKNYTDIPTEEIRALIRAVRPAGISNFDVRVSNCARQYGGSAYSYGSSFHDRSCPFVVVRIAKREDKVRCWTNVQGKPGYLHYPIGSRREALVAIMAHELRHIWQSTHTRGKVWGARGRFSERDADAYALRMLRAYRRGEFSA